jgi:hypothetical protein
LKIVSFVDDAAVNCYVVGMLVPLIS